MSKNYRVLWAGEYEGKQVEVRQLEDEDPQNPREDCDNFGTFVAWHRRSSLGDVNVGQGFDISAAIKSGEYAKGLIYLPVWLYEHGCQTVRACDENPFTCHWDSGQVGWVYVSREKAIAEFGKKYLTKSVKAKALACIKAEIETFDYYLTGAVFGCEVVEIDADGNDGDVLDSCWGFYGSDPVASGIVWHLPDSIAQDISKDF